jgi:hypothetical protein
MDEMSYRVERVTFIGSIIVIALVIITFFSFIGVINPSEFKKEYCIVPSNLLCSDLVIRPNLIEFTLENKGSEMYNINIMSQGQCESKTYSELLEDRSLKVSISCPITAAKSKVFKHDLEISYFIKDKIGELKFPIKIKSVVD